ncbi:hypothetical protein [Mucilaginibacter polytrichastri]|uniref:Uncharacterized protein n=1 Tax=Mucilaginibacter polytrichastri TaxID=1302689 RepID=A0A1Q6A031_9SPHI|nr:hypothetical protein [Mucilaginibacter polytrichastri]OKS87366.1 hypothetical protein RG47T_2827 [Mucilaginibacter polytrichastri]SFT22049.1 hypothetical protein SAMN04487890_11863 [Mucilaginibacter polytrichastri]
MNKANPELPDWISRQASLGPNVEVDRKDDYSINDRFWDLLTVCCPLIFERYMIILHPFWINFEIKKLKESGVEITKEVEDQNRMYFKSLTWPNFFHLYNKEFDLKTAVSITEEIRLEIIKEKKKWPEYIWFPSEGDLDNTQITKIRDSIIEIHGDVEVNYYYCFLKTSDWNEDHIYKGLLSELEELWAKNEIKDNPTAIFPDSKEWCIVF